jgi:hypothetical protein
LSYFLHTRIAVYEIVFVIFIGIDSGTVIRKYFRDKITVLNGYSLQKVLHLLLKNKLRLDFKNIVNRFVAKAIKKRS